jgi:hypothetical protein
MAGKRLQIMPVDRIKRIDSTARLRTATLTAVDVAYDNTNDELVFKDTEGNVRRIPFIGSVQPLAAELSADGAIPIVSGTYSITKGSAAALTLAAPSAAQEGTRLAIHSETDFAHVITATGLINDGATGGAKDTATFAAFAGASIVLVAINLKWSVEALNVVTVA